VPRQAEPVVRGVQLSRPERHPPTLTVGLLARLRRALRMDTLDARDRPFFNPLFAQRVGVLADAVQRGLRES